MNNKSICQVNKTHFKVGDGIYIVKPDEKFTLHQLFNIPKNCDEFYLSDEAFQKLYDENTTFRAWWNESTSIFLMGEDELEEEYGTFAQDALSQASYFTTFEPEK